MLSIVVPALSKTKNVEALLEAISNVLTSPFEVIFVDDGCSREQLLATTDLGQQYPVSVQSLVENTGDYSAAILIGVSASQYDCIVVMDAERPYSPALLPDMLKTLVQEPTTFVLGSRYISGATHTHGSKPDGRLTRHIATLLARPLIRCSDPASGFFGFHKSRLPEGIRARSNNIALEIMVKGDFDQVVELPVASPDAATSPGGINSNLRQSLNYLLHLRLLYLYQHKNVTEFLNFGVVGLCGFLVDVSCYYLLQLFGLEHLLARALSFWPAASSTWFLNRTTTFSERTRRPRLRQWLEFLFSSTIGFTINYSVYFLLTTYVHWFDQYRLLAMVCGVICGSIFNFTASTLFVYRDQEKN